MADRRTWILDTETKGTGARMVPLERARDAPPRRHEPVFVPGEPRPRPAPEPASRPPRRFKVVDVRSREVLAEDADARATLDVLRGVGHLVDVSISVRQPDTGAWRLLTLPESRALWDLRERRR